MEGRVHGLPSCRYPVRDTAGPLVVDSGKALLWVRWFMMEEPRCPTPPVVQEVLTPKSPLLESPQSPDVEQPNQERSSPEPNCAICLGKLQNKSFTDSCLHQFCFTCLLEWSKVKAECPLCKQNFKSIIHNVRSIEDYDQYHLRPAEPPRNWVNIALDARAFRYRTTMLAGFRQDEARQHFARLYDPDNPVIPSHRRYHLRNRNHRQLASVDFRRSIYARDLWSQPLPDVTGRYRECSPEFYRNNPTQVHRLVPWLNRELGVVLNNASHLALVLDLILHLITSFEIGSSEFRSRIVLYIGHNVDHFIHEFYTFASSPYDMIGFDESTTYFRNNSIAVEIPTELSSSDESAVMVISSPEPSRSPPQLTPISVGIQATSHDVPGTSRSHIMSVLSDLAYNIGSTHAGGSSSNDSVIGLDMTIRRPSSIIRRYKMSHHHRHHDDDAAAPVLIILTKVNIRDELNFGMIKKRKKVEAQVEVITENLHLIRLNPEARKKESKRLHNTDNIS
ncbi:unnamed protein product [Timema podura]|uniref:RING-type E3 ubiquitin transferase n=1 Tax=Timema podura TaxID=61482 RepID=A0ABN7NMG8_TIMPD|nr:unnamed protein product [Timema podura]